MSLLAPGALKRRFSLISLMYATLVLLCCLYSLQVGVTSAWDALGYWLPYIHSVVSEYSFGEPMKPHGLVFPAVSAVAVISTDYLGLESGVASFLVFLLGLLLTIIVGSDNRGTRQFVLFLCFLIVLLELPLVEHHLLNYGYADLFLGQLYCLTLVVLFARLRLKVKAVFVAALVSMSIFVKAHAFLGVFLVFFSYLLVTRRYGATLISFAGCVLLGLFLWELGYLSFTFSTYKSGLKVTLFSYKIFLSFSGMWESLYALASSMFRDQSFSVFFAALMLASIPLSKTPCERAAALALFGWSYLAALLVGALLTDFVHFNWVVRDTTGSRFFLHAIPSFVFFFLEICGLMRPDHAERNVVVHSKIN